MKIKKYTNGAWTDSDKPVKKFDTYTDEATTLPLTIQTSATDAVENYQIYGASGGVGEATSGSEPAGYKIPILNTSGVTENLWDCTAFLAGYIDNSGVVNNPEQTSDIVGANDGSLKFTTSQAWRGVHTDLQKISTSSNTLYMGYTGDNSVGLFKVAFYDANSDFISITSLSGNNRFSIQIPAGTEYIALGVQLKTASTYQFTNMYLYDSDKYVFIPHRYTSNYDLFVGDSKLYADEYLDFVEQKVYRYVDGVLTPQDPPSPFPALTTYIGENNLSVDTTVQPEKAAVEYEGWKGIGDIEKYHNGEWSDNNGT